MTNEQKIRELELELELCIAVERELRGIPRGARDILAGQIAKVSCGKGHIYGAAEAFSASEPIGELWHSPESHDLRELLDTQAGEAEPDSMEVQVAALNELPPVRPLTEARQRGPKFRPTMTTNDDIIPGSQELPNAYDEAFAQAIARGQDKLSAFLNAYPDAEDGLGDADNSSIRSRAHRKAKRPEIADRIPYLRAERDRAAMEALPERWNARALDEVAREATEALTAALRACEADQGVPESARSSVRREAVRHAGRVHRAGAARPNVVLSDKGSTSSMLAEALERLYLCTCGLEGYEELDSPA